MRVADVRKIFADRLSAGEFVTDKTGVKTIEIVGASFVADEETIFGAVNRDYVEREIAWYESESLYVKDIPGGPPKIWEQVASSEGKINSNYGWCCFSPDNHSQIVHVWRELVANPNSRRAIAIYTRPTMWYDYKTNGMSDFMCTNAVQYVVREGHLHAIVQMRSNDVVFGYRNDRAWQKYMLDYVRRAYNKHVDPIDHVELGDIHWQVGSLHVYERHFKMIDPNWKE